MQEVKEAIGVESRTTIFNPTYIKEKMKGEAGAANTFAEIVQNTYGWNVMKPKAIDKEMWDEIYNVYVRISSAWACMNISSNRTGSFGGDDCCYAGKLLRKGMWRASEQQVADIAKLHTDLVTSTNPPVPALFATMPS